ncbi:MAG: entericidin A/B family lipoprotein [Hyphomonadaceae bacterium]|nr:entericidin A/B family lipoprotein [Hyphomonadaceae bacterium]
MRNIFAVLITSTALAVAGCNTVQGVGEDVESVGEETQEIAQEAKD